MLKHESSLYTKKSSGIRAFDFDMWQEDHDLNVTLRTNDRGI